MVVLYFGLPGSGKTTFLTKIAKKESKKLLSGKSKYKVIYSNVKILVDGVCYIDNNCIGKYDLSECLLLIDEATLFADNRDYKNFTYEKIEYFLEHRHFKADIYLFTQQYDGVDRKIRIITDRVYYVSKGWFLGFLFSKAYKIPYGMYIPSKKDDQSYGDIITGYTKPGLLTRLFTLQICFRPAYYKLFDSFEKPVRPALPDQYKIYFTKKGKIKYTKVMRNKAKGKKERSYRAPA